jgi:hypothetical protein
MTLIHYGNTSFDEEKFQPIKNRLFVKPHGGLWSSPVKSSWGWIDWCTSEHFHTGSLGESFQFTLKPETRILKINGVKDLEKMCPYEPIEGFKLPNFEAIVLEWDAIWLTVRGQNATRFSHPMSLYGWDCESMFVMNKDCIQLM